MKRATLFLAALSLIPASAKAAVIYTSAGSGTVRTGDGFTLGATFTVGSIGVTVTSLGAWDSAFATGGLPAATPVDIWNSSGGVVASAIVPQGTAATNQFSFTSITPVTLIAGANYTMGAYYSSSTDPADLHDHDTSPTTSADFNTFVSRFTASNTVGSISDPTGSASGVGYVGPSFQYALVPEPGSLALLAVGAAMLGRRRKGSVRSGG